MSKKTTGVAQSRHAARSLHIGLNRVAAAHYGGWSGPLGGCEFDANDMAAIARSRGIVPKVQLYATIGAGYYRIRYESLDLQDTGFGTNVGGGVKIDLVGPLRLRLDYRIFKLTDTFADLDATSQRFYAGANIEF